MSVVLPISRVEQTYLALLLLPHNALRERLQPELAACRDTLAVINDQSPQEIQDDYEAIASELGKRLSVYIKTCKQIIAAGAVTQDKRHGS